MEEAIIFLFISVMILSQFESLLFNLSKTQLQK